MCQYVDTPQAADESSMGLLVPGEGNNHLSIQHELITSPKREKNALNGVSFSAPKGFIPKTQCGN
jgi:hypothetical protein